jgi:hypothetical protein
MAAVIVTACSSRASDEPTPVATSTPSASTPLPPPSSIAATATTGPGTGTAAFGGAVPEVPVRVTMPAGWELDDVFVLKSGSDPRIGIDFFDVANIYADGCEWTLVDPPPGPTVDDLVAAYARLPGGAAPARDVVVDGFHGRQVKYAVPDYNPKNCKEGKFGLLQEDHQSGVGDAPSLWAQSPNRLNEAWILDVDGTRLVVLAGYPRDISANDRVEVDAIISSLRIG